MPRSQPRAGVNLSAPAPEQAASSDVSLVEVPPPETSPETSTAPAVAESEPEEFPPPEGGWAKAIYSIRRMFGLSGYTKQQLAELRSVREDEAERQRTAQAEAEARERAEAEHQAYITNRDAAIERLIMKLRIIMNSGVQPTISMLNYKSGGKTTTCVYMASLIAEYCRKTVLIFPSTKNSATSTLSRITGIQSGNMITVRQLSQAIKEYDTYRALSQFVPRTVHGVGIISEDRNNQIEDEADYDVNLFDKVIRTITPNVDVLFMDHGNDNVERTSISLRATHMSDVLVFTSFMRVPISIENMTDTYYWYSKDDGYDGTPPTSSVVLPGERMTTISKLETALMAVTGVKPDDRQINFGTLLRPQGFKRPDDDHYLIIPSDPYIAQEQPTAAHLDALQPETLLAYLELTVTCLEQAARNQGYIVSSDEATGTYTVTSPRSIDDVTSDTATATHQPSNVAAFRGASSEAPLETSKESS